MGMGLCLGNPASIGNSQKEWRAFLRFHSTEVLISFDDVPTGRHTRTTRPVLPPEVKAGQEPITWSLHLPYKPLESNLSDEKIIY